MFKRFFIYGFFLLVTLLGVINFSNLVPEAHLQAIEDAQYYIHLSLNPAASVPAPFSLRLLSPFLVHQIMHFSSLGIDRSWLLLTVIGSLGALIYTFKLLYDHFRISLFTSVVFVLFLAYTYPYTFFNYYDFWLVDPLSNLFFTAGLYYLFTQRWLWFTLVILIGSFNKETILLLLPLALILPWLEKRKLNLFPLIALVGYVVFRYLVSHYVQHQSFFQGPAGRNGLSPVEFALSEGKDQFLFYHTFDFLWILFAYALYQFQRLYSWRHPLVFTGVYLFTLLFLSRFFATDVQRVFVLMAPVVIAIVALYFDHYQFTVQRKWLLLFLLVYVAANLSWFDHQFIILSNCLVVAVFAVAFPDPPHLKSQLI